MKLNPIVPIKRMVRSAIVRCASGIIREVATEVAIGLLNERRIESKVEEALTTVIPSSDIAKDAMEHVLLHASISVADSLADLSYYASEAQCALDDEDSTLASDYLTHVIDGLADLQSDEAVACHVPYYDPVDITLCSKTEVSQAFSSLCDGDEIDAMVTEVINRYLK